MVSYGVLHLVVFCEELPDLLCGLREPLLRHLALPLALLHQLHQMVNQTPQCLPDTSIHQNRQKGVKERIACGSVLCWWIGRHTHFAGRGVGGCGSGYGEDAVHQLFERCDIDVDAAAR